MREYLSGYSHFSWIEESGVEFVGISKWVKISEFRQLLSILGLAGRRIGFFDGCYPDADDAGAVFGYSPEPSSDGFVWNMTLGNHGRSGRIYQVGAEDLIQQAMSLVRKEMLPRLQVSQVTFFSHHPLEGREKSRAKFLEIMEAHHNRACTDIFRRMGSFDAFQIWEAACEIVARGQHREEILPLLAHRGRIQELTRGIDLGGGFAPNSRFLSAALDTLDFHARGSACPCRLLGLHNCMNPMDFVEEGVLRIDQTVFLEDPWVDYYCATCTRCSQKFRISERYGHYQFWGWSRVDEAVA
ncbi:MAG: hypothetical protein IPK50_19380 [Fibrobacterota bacterium]|nr:MAG: hypothetical protein IPK50_19380 [Fibrobacterota bacterium]